MTGALVFAKSTFEKLVVYLWELFVHTTDANQGMTSHVPETTANHNNSGEGGYHWGVRLGLDHIFDKT